ncbi:MAG: hypothetical protein AB1798_14505 [Spirochaetota bacterium]
MAQIIWSPSAKVSFMLLAALLSWHCITITAVPYLVIEADPVYRQTTVIIPYSFKSESDPQPCLITLSKEAGTGYVIIENSELSLRMMSTQGVLQYNLSTGNYRLRFTVYSDKGNTPRPLPFLDQEVDFTVEI